MVISMNKYRKSIFLTFSLLILVTMLFGFIPSSYAQEDQDWSQPVNLSFSGVATDPLLVADSSGTLHVLWIDDVDGYKYSQSADEGVTWTPPRTVKFPFDEKGALPTLLADSKGAIHIFWIGADLSLFYGQTIPLDFAVPSNWQINTRLAGDVLSYDVALDALGGLHIAYIRNSTTDLNPAGVYYRQSLVGYGSWKDAIRLYESDYFRSAKVSDAFIRVATSNSLEEQKVYITWDSRPQKRVFMAVSDDSGLNWNEAQQIKGPQDTGGIDLPFNFNVAAFENKVLLMWQVGEPGSAKCTVFSQWSEDGGGSWEDTLSVLGRRSDCPRNTKFVIQNKDYMVAMMTGQGDPTLVAWSGEQWSDSLIQTQLPAFSNPVTYDAILLGCRFDLIHQNHLYVVGCDQGRGGDIWFLSRTLEPVENWFSPPNTWGAPKIVSGKSETISSLSSVADTKGIIHSIWAQSSFSDDGSPKIAIEYARWEGEEWTNPEPVISSLNGIPIHISISVDTQERILLSWVDGTSGDLFFSWANLDRANLVSEWRKPVGLPSPSKLNSASDILADGAGRIVVVYTVSINEDRGVYIVQSTDSGSSWSTPIRAFDAVSAGWERIESPKIGLSADGVLHIIFTRNTERAGQPVGLYYSHSLDGGMTWGDAQIISEGDIQWSDIVCYDERTVHIVWQENDGLVFANLSQVSPDSGVSWGKLMGVTGVSDSPSHVTLASDGAEQLHFIQLIRENDDLAVKQDNLVIQDWYWSDSRWEFASDNDVIINGEGIDYSVTAAITSDGFLGVSVLTQYSDLENDIHNEIQTFNRFLGESDTLKEPLVALIPTPIALMGLTPAPDILPTQPTDPSVLHDDNSSTTSTQRNIVGLVIIGVVMIVAALLLIRSRPGLNKK